MHNSAHMFAWDQLMNVFLEILHCFWCVSLPHLNSVIHFILIQSGSTVNFCMLSFLWLRWKLNCVCSRTHAYYITCINVNESRYKTIRLNYFRPDNRTVRLMRDFHPKRWPKKNNTFSFYWQRQQKYLLQKHTIATSAL